jgi:hypothetical protein
VIIQIDAMIQQAKTVEDLKPLLSVMVKALNTMSDAKSQVTGDTIYKDGGIIMRCDDNSYHRLTLQLSSGVPALVITNVGQNPTGA